jgi:hypothetical protein
MPLSPPMNITVLFDWLNEPEIPWGGQRGWSPSGEVSEDFNKSCWDQTPQSWELYRETWEPSAVSVSHPGLLGCTGLFLRTLRLGLAPSGERMRTEGETHDLLHTHFPWSGAVEEVLSTFSRTTRLDWQVAKRVVTYRWVVWTIESFGPYKSPGMDGIFPALQEGHNTLRRHLHLMGLTDSPLCSKCGVEEETSAHVLCRCEALASVRHAHLGSFFLEPEDIKSQNLGASGALVRRPGYHERGMGNKGPVSLRPRCIGAERPQTRQPIHHTSWHIVERIPNYAKLRISTYITMKSLQSTNLILHISDSNSKFCE